MHQIKVEAEALELHSLGAKLHEAERNAKQESQKRRMLVESIDLLADQLRGVAKERLSDHGAGKEKEDPLNTSFSSTASSSFMFSSGSLFYNAADPRRASSSSTSAPSSIFTSFMLTRTKKREDEHSFIGNSHRSFQILLTHIRFKAMMTMTFQTLLE